MSITGHGRSLGYGIGTLAAALLAMTWMDAPGPGVTLPESNHQHSAACQGNRFVSACFAPGTSADHMAQVLAHLTIPVGAAGYAAENRWTSTATNGSISTGPITLTYSFPPDISTGDNDTSNSIHAVLNSQFGSEAAWKSLFRQVFDNWSDLSGITFIEEPSDDGAVWPDSPGVLGVRGDIRIVATTVDGSFGTLAFNYFPNLGDMTLDIAEDWADPSQSYRFAKNTLLHELGHGLGLNHVLPRNETKLMEAILATGFAGPQDDDIRGAQNFYGDSYESNNTMGTAASIGTFSNGMSVTNLSLNSAADVDVYRVSAAPGQGIQVTVNPVGSSYQLGPDPGATSLVNTLTIQRLRVRVFDADGSTLQADTTASAAGSAAGATGMVLSGDTSLLIEVRSAGGANDVQRYSLALAAAAPVSRTLTVSASGASGVAASVSPADQGGQSTPALPASLTYLQGQTVQFTVPTSASGEPFSRWIVDGVPGTPSVNSVSVLVAANHSLVAQYSDALVADIGGEGVVDPGQSIQLTAFIAGGSAPYSYSWTPASTLSSANIANPIATPTETTTYNLTVTDFVGATASATATVEVRGPLAANAGPDQTVIGGRTGAMAGAASGGTPPYAYAWAPVTGLDSSSNPVTSFTMFSTRTYTLTVTDSLGETATDTVTLTQAGALSVSLPSGATIGAGQSIELTPAISGGVAPLAYSWNPSDGTVGANGAITVQPTSTTIYTLTVADALGQSDSANTTVTVAPALVVSASGPASAVSAGTRVTLSAAASGGVEPYAYAWSPADAVTSDNDAETRATVSETTTFTVTAFDAIGQTAQAQIAVEIGDSVSGQGSGSGNNAGGGLTPAVAPMVGPCGLTSYLALGLVAASLISGRVRKRRAAAR